MNKMISVCGIVVVVVVNFIKHQNRAMQLKDNADARFQ